MHNVFNHCSQNCKQRFLSLVSGQFVLLVQLHNCPLIWSLNSLKCMVVYALSRNTVVFFSSLYNTYLWSLAAVCWSSTVLCSTTHALWSCGWLFLPFADLHCTECIVFYIALCLCFVVLVPKHSYKAYLSVVLYAMVVLTVERKARPFSSPCPQFSFICPLMAF